jgi:hypothetical protein
MGEKYERAPNKSDRLLHSWGSQPPRIPALEIIFQVVSPRILFWLVKA